MDAHVTGRAVLIAWIGHVMVRRLRRDAGSQPPEVSCAVVALQAQREHYRSPQQPRIGRAVRGVAGLTAIDANTEMLEDEGAALIGVAVETGLLVRHGLIDLVRARSHSPGGSKSAVRIVTVGARYYSFLDPVFERHRELCAHVGMALFAQRGLGLAQERANGLRAVNRMTTGTCHPVQSVLRAPDIRARKRLTVAAKASVQYLLGGKPRERTDGLRSAAIIDMLPAGAVTALAACALRWLLARSDALEMRVLIKCVPDNGMARFASIIAYEVIGLLVLRFCDKDASEEYRQKQAGTNSEGHYCGLQFNEQTHFWQMGFVATFSESRKAVASGPLRI